MNVSCIIPLFNAERHVAACLESVLSQDWPIFETIVVDDGSTDGSSGILRRFAGAIRIVSQAHAGVSAARNAGLRAAQGDVIAFQDADDTWPAGRLKRLATALEADGGAGIVAGRVEILDQRPVKPAARENLDTLHRIHCMGSLLIRRSVFDRVGLFNEALAVAEDTELIMRVRGRGISIKTIDTLSLTYRLHDTNISRDIHRNQSHALEALRVISRLRRKT